METSAWRYLDLAKSVKYLRGDKTVFNFGEHLGKYTKADGTVDIDRFSDVWESAGVAYTKAELKATFDKIGSPVTRDKYLQAQRHNWRGFFIPPAVFILFWIILFVFSARSLPRLRLNPRGDRLNPGVVRSTTAQT